MQSLSELLRKEPEGAMTNMCCTVSESCVKRSLIPKFLIRNVLCWYSSWLACAVMWSHTCSMFVQWHQVLLPVWRTLLIFSYSTEMLKEVTTWNGLVVSVVKNADRQSYHRHTLDLHIHYWCIRNWPSLHPARYEGLILWLCECPRTMYTRIHKSAMVKNLDISSTFYGFNL